MRDNPVLFDLAQLLDAGIAPREAAERLRGDRGGEERSLAALLTDLKRGRSLATALSAAGFATRLETEILKAAEDTGKLSEALRLVADNFEARRARASALRMRLWLPNTIVFIALAIGVVRATTAGADLSAALFVAMTIALAVAIVTQALLACARRDASRWLALGWRFGLQRTSALFGRYFEQTFYTLFAWQVESGRDYVSGAKILRSLIDTRSYRNAVDRYQTLIAAGGAVANALQQAELLVPGELATVIDVGEQSGRLAPALRHYLIHEGHRLDRATNGIFTWLPRIYYFFVLLVGAGSLL